MKPTASAPHAQVSSASAQNVVAPAKSAGDGSAERAPIQVWTGKAIREQIHSKSLANAYRQWLYHKTTKQPRLRDMFAKPSNLLDDTLLNLKVGSQYIVVSQSDSYIRNLGKDFRGLLSSELKYATANSMYEIFDNCLANKQAAYARYISSVSEQNVYWETLILPLAANEGGNPIFAMNYTAMLSEKVDILQILYDRSPVGIIAAVPIMDGQNKTDDARILTMNNKARQILKQDAARIQLHSVGELIHFLRDGLSWSATGTSSEQQITRVDYRDPAGRDFAMTIEIINQFVLISLAEHDHPESEAKATSRLARLLGQI
jgi:hypothetical protein